MGQGTATGRRVVRRKVPQTRGSYESGPQIERAPLIRIHRFAYVDADNSYGWDKFTNQLGRLNWGAEIYGLGKMACTYIPEKDLNAMLRKRYPGDYRSRQAAERMHEKFAKSFRQFVGESLQIKLEIERATIYDEKPVAGPDVSADIPDDPTMGQWQRAECRVKSSLRPYGRYSLGVDLSLNDFLYYEFGEVTDYLSTEEKLDMRLLSYPDFKPHVKVLRSQDGALNMDRLSLPRFEHPGELVLQPPIVWRERA